MTPDPRPQPRIKDRGAIRQAKLLYPYCAACGGGPDRGLNGHHVLPKGEGGDDMVGNIVCLCGSGTSLCHGSFHGNDYLVERKVGERWGGLVPTFLGDEVERERRDAVWVRRRVGETILRDRSDVVVYILRKLGETAGADYLRRVYFCYVPQS